MPDIERAIRDHINGITNPVAGATDIRNANTCFWFRSDGGCAYVYEVPQLCNTVATNCRPLGVYVERALTHTLSAGIFDTWLESYASLPSQYLDNTTPDYLFSTIPTTNDAVQQLVYTTQIEMQYAVSVGLRDQSGQSLYVLMGIGRNPIYTSERIEGTFQRHWNRLNRDRNPGSTPETYRPNFCLTGMIHAVFGSGSFRQWTTFTFQSTQQSGASDIWFCEASLQ